MNNLPIGILDSGVGGLTLAKEIRKILTYESVIYIADSKNTPYGNKSSEEIYCLAQKLVRLLLRKKIKLIVVACNTITVTCLKSFRRDYPNILFVGTVPVIKTAAKISKNKRIGILSTSNTAKSRYLRDLIKQFARGCKTLNYGTDELVPLIEKGELTGKKIIKKLQEILTPFKKNIDVLVLGCTHFPLLRKEMQKILGKNVKIIDSGQAIAR